VNPYQSETKKCETFFAYVAVATSSRYIFSSSCSALNPLARNIAFLSHCIPKTKSNEPTKSLSEFSGIFSILAPRNAIESAKRKIAEMTP
jgi:hypothetical protein